MGEHWQEELFGKGNKSITVRRFKDCMVETIVWLDK